MNEKIISHKELEVKIELMEKIKESERKYRDLFENSPFSIMLVDMDGFIKDCNSATEILFGYNKSELINNNYKQFLKIPSKQLYLTMEVEKKLFNGEIPKAIEIQIKKKDGNLKWISVQFFLIVIGDEKFIQIMSQDITERKKAQEKLNKLEQKLALREKFAVIGEIAGHVAHELRNPLAAIKNNFYYLSKIVENHSEDFKATMNSIEEDTKRMIKIISELLDYSKDQKLDLKNLNINLLIENSLKRLKIPSDITIHKNFQENIPNLIADKLRLEQIFLNLIENAFDAMKDGGDLTIATTKEKSEIIIQIKDTGVGIEPKNLKKLFTPLFSTKIWGFGLGLSIVKKYCKLHNGKIFIKSRLGEGTIITLKFPTNKNEITLIGGEIN